MTAGRVGAEPALDTGAPVDADVPAPSRTARVLMAVIGFYRVAISPIRPPACRYAPSCSEYAVDALREWGPVRGSRLAVRRLLRCHPWHAGGFDPVPPRVSPPLPRAAV